MATLSVDEIDDVDTLDFYVPPHLALTEHSGVESRPSYEFSAYPDASRGRSASARFGQLVFVSLMMSIIAAAGTVAMRERGPLTGRGVLAILRDVAPAAPAAHAQAPVSDASQRSPQVSPADPTAATPAALAPVADAAATTSRESPDDALQLPVLMFMSEKPRGRRAALARPAAKRARAARVSERPAQADSVSWASARDAAMDHYSAGRYDQAVQAYEQAVQANPGHALTLAGLGAARMQVRDAAGAVDAYRRALRLAKGNVGIEVALGRAYVAAGELQRGRATYEHVLTRDPSNVAARSALERL